MKSILLKIILGLACPLIAWAQSGSAPRAENNSTVIQPRSSETCGNPCDAVLFVKYYTPAVHDNFMSPVGNFDGLQSGSSTIVNFYNGPGAYMFITEQPGTAALYGAYNGVHWIYLLSLNGAVPTQPPGYDSIGIHAYVYPTQVCGSVPLYHLYNSQWDDHYYTIDQGAINGMETWGGYVVQGILAYAFPLCTSCQCNGYVSQ